MKKLLFSMFIRSIPKIWMSHLVGCFVHIKFPSPFRMWFLKIFVEKYNINMEEAGACLEDYQSIGDLFTRHLKPGLRPAQGDIVHPADSEMTQGGRIEKGLLVQCKGKDYTVSSLLGDSDKADMYEGGFYGTYYLCPTDYHRVHSPVRGDVCESAHIPGFLWPVNSWSVQNIENLFGVNERVVTYIETGKGLVACIMVGATNVGKMTMSYDKNLVTNRLGQSREIVHKKYEKQLSLAVGEEVGVFHMGSSAVVLYPPAYSDVLSEEDLLFRGSVLVGQSVVRG